jgi:hypothetical protein
MMKCEFCGGEAAWTGQLSDNPRTRCRDCGRWDCQVIEPDPEPSSDSEDGK